MNGCRAVDTPKQCLRVGGIVEDSGSLQRGPSSEDFDLGVLGWNNQLHTVEADSCIEPEASVYQPAGPVVELLTPDPSSQA